MTKIYQNDNIFGGDNIYRDDGVLEGNYQRSPILRTLYAQSEFYEEIFNALNELKDKGRTLINKLINRK